jgi:C-terminal processing protease CtpA/Prc
MAGEKGYLGLSFSVDGEGFFWNPTLNTIKIEKVVSNSPAAKAGIESGDLLLEIEGKKIAGAKANDIKPYLERELGQTVRLAIQKSSGEVRQLAVVAGPKPE